MKKITALCLSLLLICGVFSPIYAQNTDGGYNPLVKIGLYYGSEAMSAANLLNYAGMTTGYSIGFYDDDRQFFTLFTTEERAITMLKDEPMWITDSNVYYDVQPSSYKYYIGSYHLSPDTVFEDLSHVMTEVYRITDLGIMAFPAFVDGEYRVRIGEHLSKDIAEEKRPEVEQAVGYELNIVGNSDSCYTVTITGTDDILFEFDSYSVPLGIVPNSEDTWFRGLVFRGGFEYYRANGDEMNIINVVDLDNYIKGVIPGEMSPTWPLEALKAQAICAKCYGLNHIGKHRSQGFDLCDTTDCQVYHGRSRATDHTDRAVDETNGIYATYDGEIIEAYYHSTSGGHTEDVENIWNEAIPYLRGVEDTYLEVTYPYSNTLTTDLVTDILNSKGISSKTVVDFYVSEYSDNGNVMSLTFEFSDGSKLVRDGGNARTTLNSTTYDVTVGSHRYTLSNSATLYVNDENFKTGTREVYVAGGDGTEEVHIDSGTSVITSSGTDNLELVESDDYILVGTGLGHNIGMSQWGAHAMAELGFTFEEILKFYYTGIDVEQYNP